MLSFVKYRDKKKEYRWRLVAENGNIVADSGDGYENRGDRDSEIVRLQHEVPQAAIKDLDDDAPEVSDAADQEKG